MPENPTPLVFEPLEKEILERVGCLLIGKAIIKVLIIRLRFEPEFVRVRKEQSAKEQEDKDEAEGG